MFPNSYNFIYFFDGRGWFGRQRVLSTGDQVKDFKDYLKKLRKVVKSKRKVKEIVSNAVFLISEGNSDLGYFAAPALLRLQSTNTYTSKMVVWTRKFIKVRQGLIYIVI